MQVNIKILHKLVKMDVNESWIKESKRLDFLYLDFKKNLFIKRQIPNSKDHCKIPITN